MIVAVATVVLVALAYFLKSESSDKQNAVARAPPARAAAAPAPAKRAASPARSPSPAKKAPTPKKSPAKKSPARGKSPAKSTPKGTKRQSNELASLAFTSPGPAMAGGKGRRRGN